MGRALGKGPEPAPGSQARGGGPAGGPGTSRAGLAVAAVCHYQACVGRWPGLAWHGLSPPHTIASVLPLPELPTCSLPWTPWVERGDGSGHFWKGRHLTRAVTPGPVPLGSLFPGGCPCFPTQWWLEPTLLPARPHRKISSGDSPVAKGQPQLCKGPVNQGRGVIRTREFWAPPVLPLRGLIAGRLTAI